MRLYRGPKDPEDMFFVRVFHFGEPLPLSDLIPVLEHMGVRTISENPYRIGNPIRAVSIHDLELSFGRPIDLAAIGERFEDTFVRVWSGMADNDSFNRLVLLAQLDWREVAMLRAYARYMKQTQFGFSQEFISDTLAKHPSITRQLVELFVERFEPGGTADTKPLHEQIIARSIRVSLLNEDRILRRVLDSIEATQRTNYFQRDGDGAPKPVLVLKLAPQFLPNIPAPVPLHEIVVHSPRVEGVHLRAGPIARGGLRWSDRAEDYRTEVLGLVKAQTVKNAVIVPTGAKGGFFVRRPPAARDAFDDRGDRMLSSVRERLARCDRQHRRWRGRAAGARPSIRWRRSVSGRGRRQRDRDILGLRQRSGGCIRLLVGRCVRIGWFERLRPQEDGNHGARRVDLRATPLQ